MKSQVNTIKAKPPRAQRSQLTQLDRYIADVKGQDVSSANRLAAIANDARHDANNSLAQTMVAAANALEALDMLRVQIDTHLSAAERYPELSEAITSELHKLIAGIDETITYLSNGRQVLISERRVL